jgi:hypothetical protein
MVERTQRTFEPNSKLVFGYGLFVFGIILLGYVTMNCVLLASGTITPVQIIHEGVSPNVGSGHGIALQIGAYTLLIAISIIFIRLGQSIL